jgi:hypothetical protein
MLSAFILALFAEMFGVPLLIFLLQPFGADYQLWDAIGLGGIQSSVYYFSRIWPTSAIGAWMILIGMLLIFFGWMKIHKSEELGTAGYIDSFGILNTPEYF